MLVVVPMLAFATSRVSAHRGGAVEARSDGLLGAGLGSYVLLLCALVVAVELWLRLRGTFDAARGSSEGRSLRVDALGAAVGYWLVASIVATTSASLVGPPALDEVLQPFAWYIGGRSVVLALATAVLLVRTEEHVFRGVVLRVLLRERSPATALLGQAAANTLWYVPRLLAGGAVTSIVTVLATSVFLGAFARWTGSIRAGMIGGGIAVATITVLNGMQASTY